MARKPRIEYEGAAYHVMSRGNGGADIFYGDKDRHLLLDTLDEACARAGWEIHAWVLMRNHYHLLLVTPKGNLVDGMKWFQGTFTQRFNSRHRRRGHLFQGRYRAQNIDDESSGHYFRSVADYIHLNPARARLLGRGDQRRPLSGYRWSSLPLYLGPKRKRPTWLHCERVLSENDLRDTPSGRRAYEAVLERRIAQEGGGDKKALAEWEREVRHGWMLGSAGFAEKLRDRVEKTLGDHLPGMLDGDAVQEVNEQAAEKLVTECLRALSLKDDDLGRMKKSDAAKAAVCGVLKRRTTVSNDWIRQRLKMGHATNVSNGARAFREGRTPQLRQFRRKLVRAGILKSKD